MIQAVNTINTNSYKKNPNFGDRKAVVVVDYSPEEIESQMQPKKKSRAGLFAKFAAKEVLTGAVVSLVVDGLGNAWQAMKKNPEAMVKTPEMLKRAGFWGVAWLAMGVVIGGIANAFRKNS